MRMIIFLLYGLIVFSACRKKPKADTSNVNSLSQYSQSRYLLSPVYLLTKIDSLNKKPITYYIEHPDMDSIVLKIYYGELIPKYEHLKYIYNIELISPSELSHFFSHLSNYVTEATQEEGDSIQNEIKKTRRERLLKEIEIESLNGRLISFYLNHPDLESLIKEFYAAKFLPSDDEKTFKLLDLLTQKHPDLFPLYFHCLNQICRYADGALTEIMGAYCLQAVLNYPHYFFTKNKAFINTYADFIGYELYSKDRGSSLTNTNYKEFIKKLQSQLDTSDILFKESFLTFEESIINAFKRMDD